MKDSVKRVENDYRRVYAIGDIHGNYNDLCSILAHFRADKYDSHIDALVFVGDFIDSWGEAEAAKVVKHVRELCESEDVFAVRGNHEQLLIDAHSQPQTSAYFQIWWQQGGRNTYNSYLKETNFVPDELSTFLDMPRRMKLDVEWMEKLPTLIEFDNYYFVHAGLWPDRPAQETQDYDRMWLRREFLDSEYDWGKLVVHGHTSHKMPEVLANRINIDTAKKSRVSGVRLQAGKEPLLFDKYGSYTASEGWEER